MGVVNHALSLHLLSRTHGKALLRLLNKTNSDSTRVKLPAPLRLDSMLLTRTDRRFSPAASGLITAGPCRETVTGLLRSFDGVAG